MRRIIVLFVLIVLVLMVAACDSTATNTLPTAVPVVQPISANNLQIVTGQRVYVPAYSQILLSPDGTALELAVTLAIHNTDSKYPLIIREVSYYNTEGDLVRDYISEPVQLPPLATTGFVVASGDQSGGWGANFIVEWGAEQPVYEPVIEAVMVSTRGTQGVSFISPGRVLSQTSAEN